MKLTSVTSILFCGLLGIFISCGNNNNQSEGAADDDAVVTDTSTVSPATTTATNDSNNTGTANDTVVKANDADWGEGSNISGTGENNGSGKTGGG